MSPSDAGPVALAFVAAINGGNPACIGDLMTETHIFTDSLGQRVEGRAAMIEGWRHYFEMFPDYRIEVEHAAAGGDLVLLTGWASGTLHRGGKAVSNGFWRIPAAWRAEIREGKIALWQVYADNKPVYELMVKP